MTATNHAITAANMALITQQWWIVPLALLSHFLLDMLPHYGDPGVEKKGARFKVVLIIDAVLFFGLVWLMFSTNTSHKWLIFAAMMAAVIPDTVWAYRMYREKIEGALPKRNKVTHFHASIQWGERDWGWVVEACWLSVMVAIMLGLVAIL